MSKIKINKNLERLIWIRRFGQPLVDTISYRTMYGSQGTIKLFLNRSNPDDQMDCHIRCQPNIWYVQNGIWSSSIAPSRIPKRVLTLA